MILKIMCHFMIIFFDEVKLSNLIKLFKMEMQYNELKENDLKYKTNLKKRYWIKQNIINRNKMD